MFYQLLIRNSIRRIFLQQTSEQRPVLWRCLDLSKLDRFFLNHPHELFQRVGEVGRSAWHKLIQHAAKAPQVAGEWVHSAVLKEFRSHVKRGALLSESVFGGIDEICGFTSKAEIWKLELWVFIDQDRRRAQITIDDFFWVKKSKSVHDFNSKLSCSLLSKLVLN